MQGDAIRGELFPTTHPSRPTSQSVLQIFPQSENTIVSCKTIQRRISKYTIVQLDQPSHSAISRTMALPVLRSTVAHPPPLPSPLLFFPWNVQLNDVSAASRMNWAGSLGSRLWRAESYGRKGKRPWENEQVVMCVVSGRTGIQSERVGHFILVGKGLMDNTGELVDHRDVLLNRPSTSVSPKKAGLGRLHFGGSAAAREGTILIETLLLLRRGVELRLIVDIVPCC